GYRYRVQRPQGRGRHRDLRDEGEAPRVIRGATPGAHEARIRDGPRPVYGRGPAFDEIYTSQVVTCTLGRRPWTSFSVTSTRSNTTVLWSVRSFRSSADDSRFLWSMSVYTIHTSAPSS